MELEVELLTRASFRSFGDVVSSPSRHDAHLYRAAEQANQGTARRYSKVSALDTKYPQGPFSPPAEAQMSLFVCLPRQVLRCADGRKTLPIRVLEKHPYTTQTFTPLGLSAHGTDTAYIVVVASPLPSGEPNLSQIRAFVANGGQAITYNAGVWHAPMVVIGAEPIAFLVLQYKNGISSDDCIEVFYDQGSELIVKIPKSYSVPLDKSVKSRL